jgi:hypothetical protein
MKAEFIAVFIPPLRKKRTIIAVVKIRMGRGIGWVFEDKIRLRFLGD